MKRTSRARREWRPGDFQIHFIHTGVGESLFLIFPDATSMLLDCGDQASITRGAHAVPVLPGPERLAGEWVARYVLRVNPRGADVDWLVVSHFHSDHTGTPHWQKYPSISPAYPGAPAEVPRLAADCARSGIGLAAEQLRFRRATDRGAPGYCDRIPPAPNAPEGACIVEHVRAVHDALKRRDGLVVEPFRLGASDQFVAEHGGAPDFSVRNVCANGRLAMPDGSIRDLYADALAGGALSLPLNENAMSLGMVFSYGAFRFATCGDFSDRFTGPDGRQVFAEDALAEAIGPVSVAKLNHHGHHAIGRALAGTLRPRVWIAPVWDNLHCTDDTMEAIFDPATPDDAQPLLIPTVLPVRHDGERPWWRFTPQACRTGCHVVVTVPEGGETFGVELIDARREDGEVLDTF